jgi:hypothetical protein
MPGVLDPKAILDHEVRVPDPHGGEFRARPMQRKLDYEIRDYSPYLGWSQQDADQRDRADLHEHNLMNPDVRKIRR